MWDKNGSFVPFFLSKVPKALRGISSDCQMKLYNLKTMKS